VRAVIALVALATFAHGDATRDAIERARELEAKLAYDEALVIIESAIQSGQSDRARLVELHLIAGRLSAGLDRGKIAEDHFAIVLALDPTRTLPEDTSPKITVPFTVARTKAQPLEVKLVSTKPVVQIEAGAPVAGVSVRYKDGRTRANRAGTSITPEGEVVEVHALDTYGNIVWSGTPPIETIETRVTRDEPGLFGRWTTWAAITGVAVAAGGVAAWRFDAAQDEFDSKQRAGMTSFTDLQAIEDRGRRWGLTANITFGVAAATAITTVVLFVRRPTVVATPNTVGVAGTF
jgi:hypothetical protein